MLFLDWEARVEMKFDYVFIIGAGGTGSHLIEPLAKLLQYHINGTSNITLIDGDSYEEANGTRQLFNPQFVGVNKAEATVQKFPWLGIRAIGLYVNGSRFIELIDTVSDEDITANFLVIMAVDNLATRKAVIEALEESDYQNYTIISPGNAYSHGEVLIYQVRYAKAITTNPLERYPTLANPEDKIPGAGCEEEAVSTPQLITANACAAIGVLLSVSAMLDGKNWFEEIHFNCEKMKIVPQGASIEKGKKTVKSNKKSKISIKKRLAVKKK